MNRRDAFLQLVLARIREFYREPHALFWVYGFPLMLAGILGWAFASARPVPPTIDVEQSDLSEIEQKIVRSLSDEGMKVEIFARAAAEKRLSHGQTDLIVVPKAEGFAYRFDPARAESALARRWVDATLVRASLGDQAPKPIDETLSKPGTRYIDFLMPGLIGMNIMGGGLFGIGFVLVDFRVRKLFKRMMATPIHRGDFLLSMFASRLIFLFPEMFVMLLFARLAFGVPIEGSYLLLAAIIFLGAFSFAGIGLLLGCRTEKTEVMSGFINLVMIPSYLLSGIFFSPTRYPAAVQPLIQALPLTQLNESLREVFRGEHISVFGWRLAILAAWGVICFLLALRLFKWN